jgi:hypothetical protein
MREIAEVVLSHVRVPSRLTVSLDPRQISEREKERIYRDCRRAAPTYQPIA